MALLFVKGKFAGTLLTQWVPFSVYPLVFLVSLKLLKKQDVVPEAEALENRTNDLLFEGLRHFDAGRMEEAYKLFSKAQSLSPDRPDVKNLVGIMEMRINDPEKLERIAVLKRKLDNSFKKKLQAVFQSKETMPREPNQIGKEE
jgi:tetratricopeptide (TPR) repeat protein